MRGACLDIGNISRYVHNLAELEDVLQLEQHVVRCARCRDRLMRIKRHSEALFEELGRGDPHAGGDCPSTIQLHHFYNRSLSERQMNRVQHHLRSCDACRRFLPAEHAGGSKLLATREPDLDLRVAAQGIRIARGAELLDSSVTASLLQRLDVFGIERSRPDVTAARQLYFEKRSARWTLRGKIELVGMDGFRFDVRLVDGQLPGSKLELWTRESVHARFAAVDATCRFARLLAPGHYFLGPSADAVAWLAVAVEWDFLTPRDLAECAFDHCCRGRFHSALRCLDEAVGLSPGSRPYIEMLVSVQRFASRFGLAERDCEIRWARSSRRAVVQRALGVLDVERSGDDEIDRVVELVRELRSQSESASDETDTLDNARIVSRRRFRTPYVHLMRRLRHLLAMQHDPDDVLTDAS